MTWVRGIIDTVEREGACARVVIIETDGPTPRAVGAAMLIWERGQSGKIGRGPIEVAASERARELLASSATAQAMNPSSPAWIRSVLVLPTGNVLGQSTGGRVHLLVELYGRSEARVLSDLLATAPQHHLVSRPLQSGRAPEFIEQRPGAISLGGAAALSVDQRSDGSRFLVERPAPAMQRFYVYGSGLVARALVKCLVELPFDVQWLDRSPGHFPREIPAGVTHTVYDDLTDVAGHAPAGSLHALMTADHDLDMAICRTLLEADDFAYLGVIGSRVKRERLEVKLREKGVAERALDRMSCPIGISGIRSKNPAVIAVSIAADALARIELG